MKNHFTVSMCHKADVNFFALNSLNFGETHTPKETTTQNSFASGKHLAEQSWNSLVLFHFSYFLAVARNHAHWTLPKVSFKLSKEEIRSDVQAYKILLQERKFSAFCCCQDDTCFVVRLNGYVCTPILHEENITAIYSQQLQYHW